MEYIIYKYLISRGIHFFIFLFNKHGMVYIL